MKIRILNIKLLKITFDGLPLFNGKGEIDFTATQRVTSENADKMNFLFTQNNHNFYLNNVLSFIGINASGKTTILKTIVFVCKMLNNESLNNAQYKEIFDGLQNGQMIDFDVCFYSLKSVYFLHTTIQKGDRLVIIDEILKEKSISKIKNKNDLFVIDGAKTIMERNNDEAFLLDDVSIMVAFNKKMKDEFIYTDMLKFTNINRLSLSEDCPTELIAFFDSNVEYIHVKQDEKDMGRYLKFFDKPEIKLNSLSDIDRYLSSGTIKGINTFLCAMKTFNNGGYLIVDELENHFNHEIVSTLIRFYMDSKVNHGGATLIFSTHYAEILDEFERNDSIYIVRNRKGITVENLSRILKRNDIKKSEAYKSDFLKGMTPMYDAYMDLKKNIMLGDKERK